MLSTLEVFISRKGKLAKPQACCVRAQPVVQLSVSKLYAPPMISVCVSFSDK